MCVYRTLLARTPSCWKKKLRARRSALVGPVVSKPVTLGSGSFGVAPDMYILPWHAKFHRFEKSDVELVTLSSKLIEKENCWNVFEDGICENVDGEAVNNIIKTFYVNPSIPKDTIFWAMNLKNITLWKSILSSRSPPEISFELYEFANFCRKMRKSSKNLFWNIEVLGLWTFRSHSGVNSAKLEGMQVFS